MGGILPRGTFDEVLNRLVAANLLQAGHTYWLGNSTTLSRKDQFGSGTTVGPSNNNSGESQLAPLSTYAAALEKCVDGRNDNIIILPGHAESLSEADAAEITKAGVNVIGLGVGDNRPTFTFDTVATADYEVDAERHTIRNVRFLANIDELAAAIDVNAAFFSMLDCEFRLTDATDGTSVQTIEAIVGDDNADEMLIKGCHFWGLGAAAAAGGTHALYQVGGAKIRFEKNYCVAAFTQTEGAVFNDTTNGTEWRICDNVIINNTTGSTKAFVVDGSTTGFHDKNRMGILAGVAPYTAAGMYAGVNYYAPAVNTAMVAV